MTNDVETNVAARRQAEGAIEQRATVAVRQPLSEDWKECDKFGWASDTPPTAEALSRLHNQLIALSVYLPGALGEDFARELNLLIETACELRAMNTYRQGREKACADA